MVFVGDHFMINFFPFHFFGLALNDPVPDLDTLLSEYREGEPGELLFPRAQFLVGARHWQRANNPHFRDRASFRRSPAGPSGVLP